MEDGLLSIGKMAAMNRLTVATLRLYDELGLLSPRRRDPETGYRYYDIAQNARLDMIAYMKELGMSLTEIGDVLRQEDITLIETILARKNEQLHQQIRALHSCHNAVERAIAAIERYRKSPAKGTIALEYIDRRYIWGQPCQRDFYQQGIRAYERELLSLRQALLARSFDLGDAAIGRKLQEFAQTLIQHLEYERILNALGANRHARQREIAHIRRLGCASARERMRVIIQNRQTRKINFFHVFSKLLAVIVALFIPPAPF